ncbi:MAG: BACON domain-containing protein [Candidatus Zixiibacteriota bacterium]
MKRRDFIKILLVVSISLATGATARADRSDFIVNDDGGVAQQSNPRIAVAGDGTFLVAWIDKRAGNNDIYLQKYNTDGNPVGSNIKINDDAGSFYQSEPALAVDLSGQFSSVWKDYRDGSYPFGPDVYFQRYDTAGSKIGVNRNLTTEWPDSLIESPDIALSMWGNGVVVWADYRNGDWDVYGQLIAANGNLVGTNFKINDDASYAQQHAPRVSYSAEGWFVVTWYDNRMNDDDIYVQLFDSLGAPLADNLKVNSDTTAKRQAFPAVAADGGIHFTVVWVDWRNGDYPANPDIYYRKFDTSLTALYDDTRLNTDGSLRAQREPAVAADCMGNLAIIWSDSTGSSWDLTGQMIDYADKLQGRNFQVNEEADSAQLQPAVSLDGRKRYVAWTDKRNGNYDIYASITTYNEPSLIPTPQALQFQIEYGGAPPSTQALVVNHAGYNPLPFTVSTSHPWLAMTPSGGTTPETLSVSIAAETLSYGTYYGSLRLVDTESRDSSVTVSVRLDVTAPIMSLSADSLGFRAYATRDELYRQTMTVNNVGSGQFSWTAADTASWLTLSPETGDAGDSVMVTVSALSLSAGNYTAEIVFTAEGTMNSPDTVPVVLEVVDNMPFLALEPDSFALQSAYPENLDTFMVVYNEGVGLLSWHALSSVDWLILDPTSGLSGDTVWFHFDTAYLAPGLYHASLTVFDSSSFNIAVTVPLELDFNRYDTVTFGHVQADSGDAAILPIDLTVVNALDKISLPFRYDSAALTVDSLVCHLPDYFDFISVIDTGQGVVLLQARRNETDSALAAGNYLMAEMFFTSRLSTFTCVIDTAVIDTVGVYIEDISGNQIMPVIVPGEIQGGVTTGVVVTDPETLPARFTLAQNFPNPFNLQTKINFEISKKSFVNLEIYNILGQLVVSLISATLPSGQYSVDWNGQFDNGRYAPSGIYFYRLRTEAVSLVRKMVLLK